MDVKVKKEIIKGLSGVLIALITVSGSIAVARMNGLQSEITRLKKENENLKNQIVETDSSQPEPSQTDSDEMLKEIESLNKQVSTLEAENSKLLAENNRLKSITNDSSTSNDISYDSNAIQQKGVSLEESNTLFDGYFYTYYKGGNADSFSVGSSTYNSGFTLNINSGTAYALFDLKNNYSRITFDVGKVTGAFNSDVVMRIYLDGQYSEEFNLCASVVSKHFEIDLKNVDSLKIEIAPDPTNTTYGFFNVIFEY